jgi:archaellum component FlaC
MPHVPGIKDTIGNYVSELEELKDDIALLEMENNLLVKKARRFITEIPDYIIQAIIELKYINNLYTNEIVACIGVKEIDRDGDINRILKTFFLEQVLYM